MSPPRQPRFARFSPQGAKKLLGRPGEFLEKQIAALFLTGCMAGLPVQAATAQQLMPSVTVKSEKLCTERPPSILILRADAVGMTPPLRFDWDLGDGGHWSGGPEVPERAYEFGRYNVILAVSDATGQVRRASIALDVEAGGCGGM